MQPRDILRYWKTLLLQGVLLAATFAAGWNSPAWTIYLAPKTGKTPVSKLARAQADLAQIFHASGGNDHDRELYSLADGLDARTLKGLLAELTTQPTAGDKYKLMSILLTRLVKLDPGSALDSLKTIRLRYPTWPGLDVDIFDAWSAKDPAAALAAITQLPRAGLRTLVRVQVLQNMADQDPQAALAALRNQPSDSSFWMYPAIFDKWAGNDPSGAATAALNLPPSTVRNNALGSVADEWAYQDPAGALAWANGLPAGQERTNAVDSAIRSLDAQNPATAAADALQLSGSSNRNELLINIATDWAQTDPTSALAWADKNLTGYSFLYAATGVLNQLGQADPASAAAALAQIPDPSVIAKAVPDLATNWAQQDEQAAMQWAQSLPADNIAVRNSAFTNVFKVWTTNDPVGAAAYIQQNLAGDPSFGALATQVVNSWGSAEPQAALNWAENLPSGDAQNSAVIAALATLSKNDPQAAIAASQNMLAKLTGLSPAQQAALQNIAAKGSAP